MEEEVGWVLGTVGGTLASWMRGTLALLARAHVCLEGFSKWNVIFSMNLSS